MESMKDLSTKELWLWGGTGGLVTVFVTVTAFDDTRIQGLMDGNNPELQIPIFIASLIGTVVIGGMWAYLHKPLHTPRAAFDLGIVAPAAIGALIAFSDPGDTKQTAFHNLLIPEVHAVEIDETRRLNQSTPASPSTIKCIVKAIIKQPC